MINKKQHMQDAANAALNALATAQGPSPALIKRLQNLSAENADVGGLVAFVQRYEQIEKALSARIVKLDTELKQARTFDMRLAGVPHDAIPQLDLGKSTGTASDPWVAYAQMRERDPVGAQEFYDKNLSPNRR